MTVKDHRLHAVAGQHISTGQTCRTGTDNGDALVRLANTGHIRTPAHLKRFVVDIAFNIADGHRAELIVQRTGTLTQTVLRTHAPADFRQGVGLM
ncbi:hypothetical protein SDC9_170755 [bioreactor metagenome]|uniref:Uncharacterized protein n=1 Tax=bioreactor metagenome TaxID=1076179 RepID=A0A645G8Z4_9ZZZZ